MLVNMFSTLSTFVLDSIISAEFVELSNMQMTNHSLPFFSELCMQLQLAYFKLIDFDGRISSVRTILVFKQNEFNNRFKILKRAFSNKFEKVHKKNFLN